MTLIFLLMLNTNVRWSIKYMENFVNAFEKISAQKVSIVRISQPNFCFCFPNI
eukprot:UN20969